MEVNQIQVNIDSELNKIKNEISKLNDKIHLLDKKDFHEFTDVGISLYKKGFILSCFEETRRNINLILKGGCSK